MYRYKEAILYTIFLVIIFIITVVKLHPELIKIINNENNIKAKTIESDDLERKLQALKASEMEKKTSSVQTKTIYKPAESGLDAEGSFTLVFNDLIEMAKYNGVKIYSIEYAYNPTDDEFIKGDATKYNVCQLNMQVIADYLDLKSFLKEVFKYPYLVNINKIELTPYTKNKKILLANIQLKLYSSK